MDIKQLEKDLWESADDLRANSKLTATEYAQPVLGLIFLSHASSRLHKLIQRIEQEDPTAQKMALMVKTVPSFPQQTYETYIKTALQGLNALYLDVCSVYRIVSTKLHVFSDSQLDASGLRLKEMAL